METPDSSIETVVQKTFFYSISKIVSFLALFFTNIILINNLSTDSYADYEIFKIFSIFFRIIALFEVQTAIIKFWSSLAGNRKAFLKVASGFLVAMFGVVLVVIVVLVNLHGIRFREIDAQSGVVVLLLMVTLFSDIFYRFLEAVMFSLHSHMKISIINLVNGFSFLFFVFFGLRSWSLPLNVAILGYVFMFVSTAACACVLVAFELRDGRLNAPPDSTPWSEDTRKEKWKEIFKFCVPLVGANIFSFFYFYVNEIFLNDINSQYVVFYSFSREFITNVISFVGLTIAYSLFPFISTSLDRENREEFHQIVNLMKIICVVFIVPLLILTLVLSREILALFRVQYQGNELMATTFKQLVFGGFFYGLSVLFDYIVVSTGKTWFLLVMRGVSAAVNLVIVLALISRFEIEAAIWGFNLSLITLILIYAYEFHRMFHETHFVRNILKIIAIYTVVNVIDYLVQNTGLYNVAEAVLLVGLFYALALATRVTDIGEVKTFTYFLLNRESMAKLFKKAPRGNGRAGRSAEGNAEGDAAGED
ncbi:MAG: lipopolysaccharide biosynthesis protein [Promethearchaeota archaeon]